MTNRLVNEYNAANKKSRAKKTKAATSNRILGKSKPFASNTMSKRGGETPAQRFASDSSAVASTQQAASFETLPDQDNKKARNQVKRWVKTAAHRLGASASTGSRAANLVSRANLPATAANIGLRGHKMAKEISAERPTLKEQKATEKRRKAGTKRAMSDLSRDNNLHKSFQTRMSKQPY